MRKLRHLGEMRLGFSKKDHQDIHIERRERSHKRKDRSRLLRWREKYERQSEKEREQRSIQRHERTVSKREGGGSASGHQSER